MLAYRITLEPDDNGTFLVRCPALPMVITFGDDETAARRNAVDAIEIALASIMNDDGDIPASDLADDIVRLPLRTALKVELYLALRSAGLTRADLAARLGTRPESIDRLIELDHRSALENLEAAFAALGRTLEIDVRRAA
ncbi:MAG: type II toxin-antitoxin system HicB family antitoxin [Methylobacteriaceae bacterium]|nr:type II toxin-antitoxin system HicB family antitoxin [Methylobacteriaceae bacterium]